MRGHWHRCDITRSLLYSLSLSCPAIFAGDTEGTSFTQTHLHSHSHSHRTKTTAMAMATRDGNDISSINFNVCLASAVSLTPAAAAAGDDYSLSSTGSKVSTHDIHSACACAAVPGQEQASKELEDKPLKPAAGQANWVRCRNSSCGCAFWLDTRSPTGSLLFVCKGFQYLS